MKLIEDLRLLPRSKNSNHKIQFGLYECPDCKNIFKMDIYSVKYKKTDFCRSCTQRNKESNHGLTKHPLYSRWKSMRSRCNNPNNQDYKDYGGRGIKVCDRWNDFTLFLEDMYPSFIEGLELDRENVNLGYSPDNCRWVTRQVQTQNTRLLKSNNKTGYRGVSIKDNTYQVCCRFNSKQVYLGCFSNPIEGAKVYDKFVIDNNLQMPLNFSYN